MHTNTLRTPLGGQQSFARRSPRFVVVVRELALVLGLYLLYRQIRHLTSDHAERALSNARSVVRLERSLHVFVEPIVQDAVIRVRALIGFLNRYYVGVHFPLTVLFIVWVLTRHHEWYGTIRTWLITVTAIGLAIHIAFPLAPPRMLTDQGFVDTLRQFGPNIYPSDPSKSVANQFAAMPSLHFGWAVIVAGGFVLIRRTRWSLLAFVHPLLTLLAIVATANHYLLDAFVALVVVALAAVACRLVPRRDEQRVDADPYAGDERGRHGDGHGDAGDRADREWLHGAGARDCVPVGGGDFRPAAHAAPRSPG